MIVVLQNTVRWKSIILVLHLVFKEIQHFWIVENHFKIKVVSVENLDLHFFISLFPLQIKSKFGCIFYFLASNSHNALQSLLVRVIVFVNVVISHLLLTVLWCLLLAHVLWLNHLSQFTMHIFFFFFLIMPKFVWNSLYVLRIF